jgi:hypothetical protein
MGDRAAFLVLRSACRHSTLEDSNVTDKVTMSMPCIQEISILEPFLERLAHVYTIRAPARLSGRKSEIKSVEVHLWVSRLPGLSWMTSVRCEVTVWSPCRDTG